MGHGFILTDQDAAPEGATFVEDFIELSLLTMGEAKPPRGPDLDQRTPGLLKLSVQRWRCTDKVSFC